MNLCSDIAAALQQGDDERVALLTSSAIELKVPPQTILDSGLISGMNNVSEQFRRREIFLPDVLLAAKAMNAGMLLLKPYFLNDVIPSHGTVVIGSVHGDVHDIGKNLVGVMLQGAGFRVIDLGKDVPASIFVEVAVRENAAVIGMSALLTTTMPIMKQVIDLLRTERLFGQIKTIVGGAPLTAEYAQEIGADAYGYDAANAVERIREMV